MAASHNTGKFPPQIKYLIGNEGCERFSFYGMRTILTVFMVQYLAIEAGFATEVYHIFVAGCYLTPLAGAYLADRYFGKFHVILWLSIVYCIGHGVIALWENEAGLYWGLGLIAIGSGGIKPCVSAFGGDQFHPDNKLGLTRFYNMFYWIINLGSATSTMLTPYLLDLVGPSVAFGIPGVLMLIATIVFWMGRKQYDIKAPTGKNPDSVPRVVMSAFRNREPGKKFLDGALKDHSQEVVQGVKAVFSIMAIFLTAVPVFWALFDQHGSTWVLQALQMDPMVMGFELKPAAMQALNPWLVMILIPLFVFGVYPTVQKFWDFTPLRRMGVGMVIAAFSFLQVAIIQYVIEGQIAEGLVLGERINIIWQFFPYVTITIAEVLISITGLEFAYTQAPKNMKSTIMSFWMLTTFLGNMYVAVASKFIGAHEAESVSGNFFLFFAVLMLGVSGIFALLARNYKMKEKYE